MDEMTLNVSTAAVRVEGGHGCRPSTRRARLGGAWFGWAGMRTQRPLASYVQPWYGHLNSLAPQPCHSVTNAEPRCRHTLWNAASAPSG